MARVIPDDPHANTEEAERRVFEILREGLPEDWIVIHSQRIVTQRPGNDRTVEREIDFILVRGSESVRTMRVDVLDEPLVSDHRPLYLELEVGE